MEKLFARLVKTINEFLPDEPIVKESELERLLKLHLEKKGFNISRQVTKKENRYDLICREKNSVVCIELKLRADTSNIKQFDRYLIKFKDGFIVVCWQASFSVRDIFKKVIDQSPIPIELIQISEKFGLT